MESSNAQGQVSKLPKECEEVDAQLMGEDQLEPFPSPEPVLPQGVEVAVEPIIAGTSVGSEAKNECENCAPVTENLTRLQETYRKLKYRHVRLHQEVRHFRRLSKTAQVLIKRTVFGDINIFMLEFGVMIYLYKHNL